MHKERKEKHFIKKPYYEGGPQAAKVFINENLKYPEEAVENGIEGTVTVRYTINHEGKVVDTKVISGLGFGCDEEAERVIRLLKFKVPKNRGIRALFHQTRHIHFKLRTKQSKTTYRYQIANNEDSAGQSYSYKIILPGKED